MRKLMLSAGILASVATLIATPEIASARPHHYYRHDYRNSYRCDQNRHERGAVGAISGTIGGGLIGNAIGHGNTGATLLGAGAGALAGHQIGKHWTRC